MTELAAAAASLVSGGRGILPLDQPAAIANAQLSLLGIARSEASRRAFREVAVTAPELERFAGGVQLDREALRQRTSGGRRFVDVLRARGIVPGIAMSADEVPLPFAPGETVVEGLDGLRGRLTEAAALGAGFVTFGAMFAVNDAGAPTDRAIAANVHALARFAALAQERRVVPILHAAIDCDGASTIEHCAQAMERILRALIAQLAASGIALDALVLQPTMVTPGADSAQRADAATVVAATLRVLGLTVPVAVAGIAFAAGSTDEHDATEYLCAMNRTMPRRRPWPLTFSYGAELRERALAAWRGRDDRVADAQHELLRAAECSGLAACGAHGRAHRERATVTAAAAA